MTKPTDHYSFILLCLQSPEDEVLQAQLSSWLAEDNSHGELYQQVHLLWEQAPHAAFFEEADAPAATARFLQLLDQVKAAAPVVPLTHVRRRWWAAAVLLMIAAAGWWQYSRHRIQWIAKTTTGRPDSVLLADGSKIYLNKHASVKYPAAFTGKGREVQLIAGEAFFDIATNPVHPFTVVSGPAQIHVLGTSFNVKAANTTIQVYVLSGSVAVAHQQHSLRLQAGQGASCNTRTGEIKADTSAGNNQLAWRTRELQFTDTSLQAVCEALSDAYGVTMVLDPGISKERKLNANFNNKSLPDILQTLTALYDYQFEQLNDTIYVHLPIKR
ncbi:ferric-dicitrate binding protein FerR, regulates iron transport through sigma-19 [Chitinophaga eiseniae]|uniref:Ferric-dicitrate binding protein FerR, regulates iron transport through sigma-19 n=1 Tax=Chitinophaga eiseniae TaxID=634771 RepID=A0A1T4QUS8_9BACT|nr:FecR domain-containing protein [Chitinophaga eiseniae]SKA07455.1 ferric-dicitrate binding protein FerR, regulates iron transport through sigma-19 [Chitinophaga eiseniae]